MAIVLPPLQPPEHYQPQNAKNDVGQPDPKMRHFFWFIFPKAAEHDQGEVAHSNQEAEHETGGSFAPVGGDAKGDARQRENEARQVTNRLLDIVSGMV